MVPCDRPSEAWIEVENAVHTDVRPESSRNQARGGGTGVQVLVCVVAEQTAAEGIATRAHYGVRSNSAGFELRRVGRRGEGYLLHVAVGNRQETRPTVSFRDLD